MNAPIANGEPQRFLLADIGGTNARFALADATAEMPLLLDSVQAFPVAEFPSLADAARHYLERTAASVDAGVFAVAGRVDGDEARITNHPWVISRARLRSQLGLREVVLINDFAAQAMAIPLLRADDVAIVGGAPWRPGVDGDGRDRTYAVIGPGTGLGVSGLLVRDGRRYPLETEGGHASFPPGTPEELTILDVLSRQFGRVSNERLICGPGLVNIHRALSEIAGVDPGPVQPADITTRAAAGDPRATRAVDVFCAVFGAIAGDVVLTLGAWDGVFLTGGLVPRMLDALRHSGFRQRFEHKGRFSSNMARVPSVAVLHPHAGLLGAAALAQDHARETAS
ncbi:glucokinase [Luteimonas sp. Y-2-2-4F]|nr:glucokinase [Luteimonas sp. Y-2-2-4F]MCD9031277.1 glucokinase [Luteimonas sp. Y-2-2-4F]